MEEQCLWDNAQFLHLREDSFAIFFVPMSNLPLYLSTHSLGA